jgi:hypothetical protein
MAFTARPHAPLSPSNGLGAGIESFGANIGAAIQRASEEHKRNATQAKAVETFLSTLPPDSLPMPMQAFKNLSAQDKIGVGTGLLQAQQWKRDQQHEQLFGAQLREADEQMNARRASAENATRTPAFLEAVSRLRRPGMGNPLPEGFEGPTMRPGFDVPAALGRASRETGFQIPPAALGKVLEDLGQTEASKSYFGDLKPGTVVPLRTLDGKEFPGMGLSPVGPNAGQIVTDPSSVQAGPIPQFDVDGVLVGYSHPTGKGGFRYEALKPAVQNKMLPMLDPKGREIPGMLIHPVTGQTIDQRNLMQKNLGNDGFNGVAKPVAQPKWRFNVKTGQLEPVE